MDAGLVDRIRGALWGLLIGDALAMPVHWYYNPQDIVRHFGSIKRYRAPRDAHPSSIMSLSNTGGHGRGDQSGRIIGDIINHGKRELWGKRNVHYHIGLKAGENTLNAICARLVTRSITNHGGVYDSGVWLKDYVAFMTTPGSHNDTYAESFHRDFFANYAAGVPPERCARGTEAHNTAQVGGLVMLAPVISAAVARGQDPTAIALAHLRTTHESTTLEGYASKFAEVLAAVLRGEALRDALRARVAPAPSEADDDLEVTYSRFGPACYIDSSFPVACHMAYKYAEDFRAGVLANTNVGGENCHRGSVVGAMLGAAAGESGIPQELRDGLFAGAEIKEEIDAFLDSLASCKV